MTDPYLTAYDLAAERGVLFDAADHAKVSWRTLRKLRKHRHIASKRAAQRIHDALISYELIDQSVRVVDLFPRWDVPALAGATDRPKDGLSRLWARWVLEGGLGLGTLEAIALSTQNDHTRRQAQKAIRICGGKA